MDEALELTPQGPFSLAAAAGFGFGPTEGRASPWDGALRLAFAVDGGRGHAGAVLRQRGPDGPVTVELALRDGAEAGAAPAQVARTLSLDHDGRAFQRLGESDHVLGALQRAHPGQRPVLFSSPYEAAAWSVISARRPPAQGARVRAQLGSELGATFELAGVDVAAFPQPDRLLEVGEAPGLSDTRVQRLHGVALAALAGELDLARLHELGPDAFAELAERWRPFRTWAAVLIRLAGTRGTTIQRSALRR